jgi:hypothetical protein
MLRYRDREVPCRRRHIGFLFDYRWTFEDQRAGLAQSLSDS